MTFGVALLSLTGCISSIEERSARSSLDFGRAGSEPEPSRDEPPPCVMEVPGTGIWIADVEGGVAVRFETVASESVGSLRRAVRALRDSYADEEEARSQSHEHSERARELARQFRSINGELPPHTTEVVDVNGGARLTIRAVDARDVELLRTKMRAEIATMQRGVCPLIY